MSYTANTTGILTKVNSGTRQIEARNGSADASHDETNLEGDMPAPGSLTQHYEKVSGESRIQVDRDGTIRLTSNIAASETGLSFVLRVTDIGGLTADLTVPLCINAADTIGILSSSCATPT